MSIARQYLANLKSGIKLAFFLPAHKEEIHGSAPLLLLLFATAVLLHFVRDFALVGLEGQLFVYGLPGVLLIVPILLTAAVVVAWIAGRGADALALATAFAALSLPILAVELAASALADGSGTMIRWPRWIPWMLWQWFFPAWFALAAAVATFYLLRPAVVRSGAAGIVLALIVALPLGSAYRERTLWMKPYDEDAMQRNQYMAAASEDAIYQQPKVLARALDAIEPGRKGVVDLYYVGFGGYARQDVFLREVKSVEAMMRDQFGAQGRTASLLNNPKTVMDMPIASATSLRAVLKRVGEAMNRDEDVLFLFMTSHGAKDRKFALEFWPLRFNELTPTVLKSALDDAGIQWRVIVVSACYAGGFIDALKDDRSIIIAAAGPDKKSFGCSHEAEWTYFGKAFFDEALRAQPELIKAFALARAAVAAREKKDEVETHSDPQIAAGKAMERKWGEFLAQPRNSGKPSPAKAASVPVSKDAVDELVDLAKLSEVAGTYMRDCLREMANNSPSVQAEKDPGYFGAITRDSPQWPKLVAAFERYTQEYCASTSDGDVLRRAYVGAWREAADEATVRSALRHLRSRDGQRVLEAENRVSLLVSSKLVEMRRAPADAATARYQQEFSHLNAEARSAAVKPKR